MITDASEFKQRLKEIQDNTTVTFTTLPSNESRFIIDLNSRTISIPIEFEFLAVKNDHKAETVYFECDRYFDDVDLSQHTCVVQTLNINNDRQESNEAIIPVTYIDTTTIDGKIIFGWSITNESTQIDGYLYFAIRFYSIDEDNQFIYNINTVSAQSLVLDTLDVNKNSSSTDVNLSELQIWLDKMNELNLKAESTLEKAEEILQNYKVATVDEVDSYLGIEVI